MHSTRIHTIGKRLSMQFADVDADNILLPRLYSDVIVVVEQANICYYALMQTHGISNTYTLPLG